MNRAFRRKLYVTALLLGSQGAMAQDLLLQARPGEVRFGPQPFPQNVRGVDLSLRASAFVLATPGDDRLRINARVVADLSDLQSNIARVVDTIPLPNNDCNRQGGDNLYAKIFGKQIAVTGNVATLTLHGEVDWWWICSPWRDRIKQPFDATLPFTLEMVDSHTVAVRPGNPNVVLGGPLGNVTSSFIRFIGVDVNGMAKQALDGAIDPKLLRVALPEYLLLLNPVITRADLVSNNGTLAALVEMDAGVDPKVLLAFVQMLLNRPHS